MLISFRKRLKSFAKNKNSPKIDKQAIDSDELKEAHENLKKLVMEKVSDKTNNDQVLAKYNEDPEKWREELKEELRESKVDQDKQIIKEAHLVVNYQLQQKETAFARIVNSATTTRGQLDQISELGLNQAHRWYQYSLVATALGFIIIIIGIGLIYFTNKNALGILTTVAGIIPEIAAALVFQQAKEANKRLDDFYKKLIELEEFNKAFEITLTTGEENQDHYKGLIISRLLGLHVLGE
jgi:preprotein translocase subunit SecF